MTIAIAKLLSSASLLCLFLTGLWPFTKSVGELRAGFQTPLPSSVLNSEFQQTLASLMRSDSEGFITHLSKHGVSFGIDSDPVPLQKITADIQQRKGIYCYLFDSSCLRKRVSEEWKKAGHAGAIEKVRSLRETIGDDKNWDPRVSPGGDVNFKLVKGSQQSSYYFRDEIEFSFSLENGRWKLVHIE